MSDEHGHVTITRLEIRNFQKIRAGVWDLAPGLQRLTSDGRNRQGKTSVLRAIRTLFEGAGAVPPVPVNTDAEPDDEAFVRGALSDGWTIRRSFTERGSYLYVIGPDGGKHGQTKIDAWTDGAAFSPLSFFNLRPSEQAEVLLGLASDPNLGEKLEENAAEDEALREERRPHNSEIQRLRKVREPEGERPEPIDVSAEMKRMGELQKMERERGDALRDAEAKAERARGLKNRVENFDAEIAELERRLDELRGQRETARADHLSAQEAAKTTLAAARKMEDPSDEMDEVRARIERADAAHEALEPWKEWERAQTLLEKHQEVAAELTSKIQVTQNERDELIAGAEFPIPGLDFTPEGEVTLNDLPLEQASGAERVELAIRAAVADNPRLRVVLVDEGNDLDADALERTAELAREHELQVIVARLGLEGAGELEVVDGWGPVPEDAEDEDAEAEEVSA